MMRESGFEVSPEISIAVNMLTFLSLWHLRRYRESVTHLEYAASLVNSFIKGIRTSTLNRLSLYNLYSLVVMGLAGLTVQLDRDKDKALEICREGLTMLHDQDTVGGHLLASLTRYLREGEGALEDYLISSDYENIFYLSVFRPFISPQTPIIKINE